MAKVRVIGLGNEFRGDDAVGLVVARRLREALPDSIEVIEHVGDGASLMYAFERVECVYLIDAVKSGAEIGTIHRLDARDQTIPTEFFHYSTHAFSLAEAVEVARRLNRLPLSLLIYGIEGTVFDYGAPMSPEVEAAARAVEKELLTRLK